MARTDEQVTLPAEVRSGALRQHDADKPYTADDELRDAIYKKYRIFIKPGTSPAEAAEKISALASKMGYEPSAWMNPEERAEARRAYAAEGKNPEDVRRRWDESEYLLDPRTYEYMQKFGRDIDFLQNFDAAQSGQSSPATDAYHPSSLVNRHRDSEGARLYRSGMFNGRSSSEDAGRGYTRWSGIGSGVADAVSNPDTASGWYMAMSETVPNFLRMQGSGETDTAGESWRAAQAVRMADGRYRMNSPAPILDLPAGASKQDIGRRIAELRAALQAARVPQAEERWQRTRGWTPPGWVADIGDFTLSMVDPTALIPLAKFAGAGATATKAAVKGLPIAGKGWVAPIAKKAIRPLAADAGYEWMQEQAVGHPLQAVLGGLPERSGKQYVAGFGKGGPYFRDPPADGSPPPKFDFDYKTDEELKAARQLRGSLYDRLAKDRSIENADSEAYSRLRAEGTVPSPPKFYWGMSPSGPAY